MRKSFVGRETLRQLHAATHSIRILSRDPKSRRVQEAANRYGMEVFALERILVRSGRESGAI